MPDINQERLAKLLSLSRPTVSRALANHPAIAADTRERVQALAAKLGYSKAPTRSVRRPRQSRPITFGVLIGSPVASTDRLSFPQILQGIRTRAAIEHAAIDVLPIDSAELSAQAGQRRIFRHIREADWRGALLIYPFEPALVHALSEKLSLVSVLMEYKEHNVDLVDTDHGGVRSLVERLAQAGHRRIGFITWLYPAGGVWASRRFAAYTEELFHQGLELRRNWVLNLHGDRPQFKTPAAIADEAARRCRKDGVTAWVCAADHQAYQLLSDLRARGIEAPRQCSITGFDGNEAPPGLPALTTLRVPNEDIGSSAIAQLTSRLLHPGSSQRKILVETTLLPGSTTLPPFPLP
jgi:LacI family transcriptional regulator